MKKLERVKNRTIVERETEYQHRIEVEPVAQDNMSRCSDIQTNGGGRRQALTTQPGDSSPWLRSGF
jgi:hypothetical protein